MPEAYKVYGKSLPETIDPPERVCFVIEIPDTPQYRAALMGQLEWLGDWRCWEHTQEDFSNPPARNVEAAQLWLIALTEACQFMQCPMTCEDMLLCLAPYLAKIDEMHERIEEIEETVDSLEDITEQNINSNAAQPPENITNEDCFATYAGALALVKQMDKNNRKYYAEAEASLVDNASEALSIVLEIFPKFQGQTYDEAFELGNAYFENQVLAYNDAYDAFEPVASCDLMTRIAINNDVLTVDVWGDWLFNLPVLIPDNATANVYTRYSPLRQTFLNQIAAIFNQENSLQSYFDELWQIYNAGTKTPVEELPAGCECVEHWCIHLDAAHDLNTFFSVFVSQAQWTGTGWGILSPVTTRISIQADFGTPLAIKSIRIVMTEAITNGDTNTLTVYTLPTGTPAWTQPADADTTITTAATFQAFFIDAVSDYSLTGAPIAAEIIDVYIEGFGIPPEIGELC